MDKKVTCNATPSLNQGKTVLVTYFLKWVGPAPSFTLLFFRCHHFQPFTSWRRGWIYFKVNFMVHINWNFPLFLTAKHARYIFGADGLISRENGTFLSLQQNSEQTGTWLVPLIRRWWFHLYMLPASPHPPWRIIRASLVLLYAPGIGSLSKSPFSGPPFVALSWADGVWKAWLINMFKYRRQSFLCAKQLLNITDRPAMDQQNSYSLMNITHWRNGKWLRNHQMSAEYGKYLPSTFHKLG